MKGEKMRKQSILVVILIMTLTANAKAGVIIQPQSNWGYQIKHYMWVGQTFTAEDALIKSIGFYVNEMNPHMPFAPIWVDLFAGVGTSGTFLGRAQLEGIEPGYSGFYDADFTSVTLTVGQVYTATLLSSTDRAAVRGTYFEPPPGPYAGGEAIFHGAPDPSRDLAFRVLPMSEPTTPPVANADGPYTIYAGDLLTLDASGSTDDGNDIVSYVWDLDDNGSFETDAGSQKIFNVNYAYLESIALNIDHTYNIHLQVTDSEGQSDVADSTLIIIPKPATIVAVDIKPGSCPNPLNVKSKGVLPVAILGSEDFDVYSIDIASIRLADVAPIRSSYEDVGTPLVDANECECSTEGPDGYLDLTLKFETQMIVEAIGEVNHGDELVLELTGVLSDETPIEGSDCIVIRGKHKPPNRADFNVDGIVDMADFAAFAENWLQLSIVEY
jgi:hypothetical protein